MWIISAYDVNADTNNLQHSLTIAKIKSAMWRLFPALYSIKGRHILLIKNPK